jgi:hydrogenase maturation protein HypF
LLGQFGRPVVATSGNISGEPVITSNPEAGRRLAGIADAFLHHDRPIVRPADDPVVRPIAGCPRTLRLGRGLAPLERSLPAALDVPTLAIGGHLKVTVALAWDDRVVVSPHIGDLDSPRSLDVFKTVVADLQDLYGIRCRQVVRDLHPGFAGSRWAEQQGLPVLPVQHHMAHASALAGEHPDVGRWLVFTWDGLGYGRDGTLWGGEGFLGRPGAWDRVTSWRPFRLPGGDKAGREPWRSAAALTWEQGLDWHPGIPGSELAHQGWSKDIGAFTSSAVGRLFDAAAALVLGKTRASFEGQGPMELEQAAHGRVEPLHLPLAADAAGIWRSDWGPLLPMLMDRDMPEGERACRFHTAMARAVMDQALRIRASESFDVVGLSGGVFQNRLLSELACEGLAQAGFEVRLHREVPANDGGLSFGQVMEALALSERRVEVC